MIPPTERNLDSIYFRVERDGKYKSLCFTDLTSEEQVACLARFDKDTLIRMCCLLSEVIRGIGDQFNIKGNEE